MDCGVLRIFSGSSVERGALRGDNDGFDALFGVVGGDFLGVRAGQHGGDAMPKL